MKDMKEMYIHEIMKDEIDIDKLSEIDPALSVLKYCTQENNFHELSLWEHTKKVIEYLPKKLLERVSANYHDTGKYYTSTFNARGYQCFLGHEKKSAEIAESSLRMLGFGKELIIPAVRIIRYHDAKVRLTSESIRKLMGKIGPEYCDAFLAFKEADILAHSDAYKKDIIPIFNEIKRIYNLIK